MLAAQTRNLEAYSLQMVRMVEHFLASTLCKPLGWSESTCCLKWVVPSSPAAADDIAMVGLAASDVSAHRTVSCFVLAGDQASRADKTELLVMQARYSSC